MVPSNNTLQFPQNLDQQLEETIHLYESSYENDKKLLDTFSLLLDEGCEEASFYIGSIYEEGLNGVTKDLEKALFYYERSAEYVGDIESHLALGRIYFYGIGVPTNYERSYECFSLVEKQTGNAIASFMLGKFFMQGILVNKDLLKAEQLFNKAIDKGYTYGIRNMASLEYLKGNKLKSVILTLKSAIKAMTIALKNPKDVRLRAG